MPKWIVIATMLCICSSAWPQATSKKLIEFGWDEPNTDFLRKHITEMEQTPFDGTVFTILATEPNGQKVSFLDNGWGTAVDPTAAAAHFGRAAEAGHAWAQYNLGHLYLDGRGVARDRE